MEDDPLNFFLLQLHENWKFHKPRIASYWLVKLDSIKRRKVCIVLCIRLVRFDEFVISVRHETLFFSDNINLTCIIVQEELLLSLGHLPYCWCSTLH